MPKKKLLVSLSEKEYKAIKIIAIQENTTCSSLISEYIQAINKNRNIIKAIKDMNK